jgi:thymidylate synthase (FAD)
MNLIKSPTVYLLGKMEIQKPALDQFLKDHEVTWESDTEVGSEYITETAGRICYMSYAKPRPGGNEAYINHIKSVGHGSVLEHAVWSFIVTGVSRTLTHELVRHRAGFAYSQLSQRYVEESVADYVLPDIIAKDKDALSIWKDAVGVSHKAYLKLVKILDEMLEPVYKECEECGGTGKAKLGQPGAGEFHEDCVGCQGAKKFLIRGVVDKTARRKEARQAARSVLPNATETKITVTANARALRHFIEQRASEAAEPEIRKLAKAIWRILAEDAPNIFGDYKEKVITLWDGSKDTVLVTEYRKV